MLCRKEKIQPRVILTCCSSWDTANECLAWCSLGPRRTFNLFWTVQHVCAFFHVFILHDGSFGTTVSKVYLVETPHDKFTNGSICTKENDINTTYSIAWKRVTNAMKDCNEPCRSLVVNTGGKNQHQRNNTWNNGEILFYFSSNAFKSDEHDLYPLRAFIAEFGGYLGLLLGYSLLDFTFKLINLFD